MSLQLSKESHRSLKVTEQLLLPGSNILPGVWASGCPQSWNTLSQWSPTGPLITPGLKASVFMHWLSLVSKRVCVLDDAQVFCLFFNDDFPNAEAGGWRCPSFTLHMFISEWCVCRTLFPPHWGQRRYCSEKWITFSFCIQTSQPSQLHLLFQSCANKLTILFEKLDRERKIQYCGLRTLALSPQASKQEHF